MSSFVDPTAGAVEHCEAMCRALGPEHHLSVYYYQPMASYCQEKLWHQLTVRVLEFVHDPAAAAVGKSADSALIGVHSYLALYDKVVLAVGDTKLDPLQLGRIAAAVAHALSEHDMTAAKAVLENLLELLQKSSANAATSGSTSQQQQQHQLRQPHAVSATIYVQSQLSLLQLQQQQPPPTDLAAIQDVIRQQQATLRTAGDQPALVHAAHYEQAMTYFKVVGPPEAFFHQAMHFLHYAPVPTAAAAVDSSTDKTTAYARTSSTMFTNYQQLAIDLCLAALTGEGVYNLSQVVEEQATLLQLLTKQQDAASNNNYAWLVELLQACAAGHVAHFSQLTRSYAAEISTQPALVHRAAAVQEKLTLLALVDLVFHKPSHERHLSFEELAAHLQCTADQVEWIVMRALSVRLLEGHMDQVTQVLHVTWVVPRVLNASQLQALAERYAAWAVKTSQTKTVVQEQTAGATSATTSAFA